MSVLMEVPIQRLQRIRVHFMNCIMMHWDKSCNEDLVKVSVCANHTLLMLHCAKHTMDTSCPKLVLQISRMTHDALRKTRNEHFVQNQCCAIQYEGVLIVWHCTKYTQLVI